MVLTKGEAETDYVVSQYVRVKNILGMAYTPVYITGHACRYTEKGGRWFLDLRLTEMTAHRGKGGSEQRRVTTE